MEEERQEETVTFTKQKPPFNMRKILAWVILVVVIIVIIILISAIVKTVKKNKAKRVQETTVVREEPRKEEVVVPIEKKDEVKEEVKPQVGTDIVKFLEEYKEDSSAANTKYVGKEIETYGYIQNMTTSFADGRPFISIIPIKKGMYTDERIQCFVSDSKVFENFKTGDGVIVKGTVQNIEFGLIPFEGCSIRK